MVDASGSRLGGGNRAGEEAWRRREGGLESLLDLEAKEQEGMCGGEESGWAECPLPGFEKDVEMEQDGWRRSAEWWACASVI